jgi:hypothetical protein
MKHGLVEFEVRLWKSVSDHHQTMKMVIFILSFDLSLSDIGYLMVLIIKMASSSQKVKHDKIPFNMFRGRALTNSNRDRADSRAFS